MVLIFKELYYSKLLTKIYILSLVLHQIITKVNDCLDIQNYSKWKKKYGPALLVSLFQGPISRKNAGHQRLKTKMF